MATGRGTALRGGLTEDAAAQAVARDIARRVLDALGDVQECIEAIHDGRDFFVVGSDGGHAEVIVEHGRRRS